MQSYILKITRAFIVVLLTVLCFDSSGQEVIQFWRVCNIVNPDGDDSYKVRLRVSDQCDDIIDKVEIFGRVGGSTSYESLGEISIEKQFTEEILVGKDGIEFMYAFSPLTCFGKQGISDTIRVDRAEPSDMDINVITVENGKVVIKWSEHPDSDIAGYELYSVDEQSTSIPITEKGKEEREHELDTDVADPQAASVTIRIVAIDSCGLKGTPEGTSSTIYTEVVDDNPCEDFVTVKWNDYVGSNWIKDFQEVILMDDKNNVLRTELVGAGVNQWTFSGLSRGKYKVSVRERKQSGENIFTESNVVDINREGSVELDTFYINSVSITNDKELMVNWRVQETSLIRNFVVSQHKVSGVEVVARVDYDASLTQYGITDDWKGGVQEYTVKAMGICGGSQSTDISKNMVLTATQSADTMVRNTSWTEYTNWIDGVEKYAVEFLDNGTWREVGETALTLSFDHKESLTSIDSGICYRIVAKSKVLEADVEAISNVACVEFDFHGVLPNGFTPSLEENNIYKIPAVNVDGSQSRLQIFNRWGQKVYDDVNPVNGGWNGNVMNEDGKECPPGVYVYRLELRMLNKKTHFYTGTISLIR